MKRLAFLGAICMMAAALAQEKAPTTQHIIREDPAQHDDYRQRQLEASQVRQSNWVDESAELAGAKLPADKRVQETVLSPSAPLVQSYVAKLTNVTLTPGQLPAAAGMLSANDAKRITTDLPRVDLREHDNLVRSFRDQWKTRYGTEFDLTRQTLATYYVLRGEHTPEDAIIVSHRFSGAGVEDSQPAAQAAEEHAQDAERIATLVIPANPERKWPPIVVVLNNDSTGTTQWKLNTPDTLTAQRLQRNLDQRLTRLLDGQASWPADVREAYRMVTYQVLASFNDQPVVRPRERPANDAKPANDDNPSIDS
jgi:hypothetical protein